MAEQTPDAPRKKRDFLSVLGMVAVAGAAAFTSYSGLDRLALMADWPSQLALMLPITIDAYAMTATRVWLSPAKLTRKARAWARGNAIGAIATSVAGNMLYHAAAAHVLAVSWPVVVGISAIPSVVLGLTVHLWHTAEDTEPEPAPDKASPGPAIAEPETVRAAYPILGQPGKPGFRGASEHDASRDAARPAPQSASTGSRSTTGDRARKAIAAPVRDADKPAKHARQLDEARAADQAHRTEFGKPISARKLAEQLHIHQSTAGEILRELRTAPALGASPAPAPAAVPVASTSPPLPAPSIVPAPVPRASDAPPVTVSVSTSDALPGAVPGPRAAPVDHANGSRAEPS
jgi:hypothetical protein